MPTAKVVNAIEELRVADRIVLNHYPNGTYDPFELLQDNNGNVRCQRRDTEHLVPILFGEDSGEADSGVTRGTFDTLAATVTTHGTDIGVNATDITTNQGNITTNTGNITTNSTDIGDNGTDITTNTADISTLNSAVSALGAQNDAQVLWLKQTNIDFATAGSTPITIGLPTNARVFDVKFVFDGTDAQRTPQTPPTLTVEFTNGAAATVLDWTSAAWVVIPEYVFTIPQYTPNDGGAGSNIQVTTSQTTFNATPAFTILVGIIKDPLT